MPAEETARRIRRVLLALLESRERSASRYVSWKELAAATGATRSDREYLGERRLIAMGYTCVAGKDTFGDENYLTVHLTATGFERALAEGQSDADVPPSPAPKPAGHWQYYPWPNGCADPAAAARTTIEPKPEWRATLEHWLPGYTWPDEPRREDLERQLMAPPFNLAPADFDASLTIDRVVAWLEIRRAPAEAHVDREPIGFKHNVKPPALLAGDEPDEPAGPALTPNQQRVLLTMARFDASRLLSAAMIVQEMDPAVRLYEETVRQCVVELIDSRLAERPRGERSGARLTTAGRRLAGKIAD